MPLSPIRIALLAAGALALAIVSRRSVVRPTSHGFHRYFAFVCILALMLLNTARPFPDATAFHRGLSWFLLMSSFFIAVHGWTLLIAAGNPRGRDDASPNFGIENTVTIVEVGIYRWVRHPLYSALLALAWGFAVRDLTWLALGIALAASLFIFAAAKVEERENTRRFGDSYRDYMRRTRMFLPFVW